MANTFKNITERTVGTSPVTVGGYVVPSATQTTLIGLTLCNITGSVITVSAILNDGVNDTHIVKDVAIPVGSTLVPIGGDQKIVLMTGDRIDVSSNTTSSVDVIASLLEIA